MEEVSMKRRTLLSGLAMAAVAGAASPLAGSALAAPLPNFGPEHHVEAVWREGDASFLRVRFRSHAFVLTCTDRRRWRTV
jgi:hypothetical protein